MRGSFGRRGEQSGRSATRIYAPAQAPDEPPLGSDVVNFLTKDWKRIFLVCALVFSASLMIYGRVSELTKSPQQIAQEAEAKRIADAAQAKIDAKTAADREKAAQLAARPPLKVNSYNCVREYGFMTITGTVTNRSSQSINNLMVMGLFGTADGTIAKTADAMVDFQPLLPGQESPFKALTTINPALTTCGVKFKILMGGEVKFEE